MPAFISTIHRHAPRDKKQAIADAWARSRTRPSWGVKTFASIVDQTLTSSANFGVSILAARWMSTTEYGAFAVAFASYLFLAGFHNALLLEPTSVIGPARHPAHLLRYFAAQLRLHSLLVWPLTAAALLAALFLHYISSGSELISALVGGGLSLPFLLLLWLARRFCYVLQSPSTAVFGSAACLALSLLSISLLRLFGQATPASAFESLGFGSLCGACLIIWLTGIHKKNLRAQAVSSGLVLRENWGYGRWLVGSALFYAIYTSTQTFYLAGKLGLADAGVLRAMQVPSLVMTQIIAAIGLLVLPSLAFDFGRGSHSQLRRKAKLVSLVLGCAALLFAGLLLIAKGSVENLLYLGKYALFSQIIPVLALIPAANGLCAGYSMALRASHKPHFDFLANACGALVAVVATPPLVRSSGVLGAAIAMVLSFIAVNLTTLIFFWRTEADTKEGDQVGKLVVGPAPTSESPVVMVDDHV
jgi:O-antigen/teichoic acid export membrane protein